MGHVNADSFHSILSASRFNRSVSLLLGVSVVGLLIGCSSPTAKSKVTTTEEIAGRLRPGDQIQVRLDAGSATAPQTIDATIDENGEISLPLVGHIKAAGLTQSELAESIQANYVPRYYVRCNATVLAAQRFCYIAGEVRSPGRFLWSDDMTLLKAISTAGGFTDYANRGKVELVRGKERQVYNCGDLQRNPGKDPLIRPGDTITVQRSIF